MSLLLASPACSLSGAVTASPTPLVAGVFTNLPGREVYETVHQFDALSGGAIEPVSVGEIALFKTFDDGRVTLEAVLNGWYVTLTAQGFDRKHLLLLAELLLARLTPY